MLNLAIRSRPTSAKIEAHFEREIYVENFYEKFQKTKKYSKLQCLVIGIKCLYQEAQPDRISTRYRPYLTFFAAQKITLQKGFFGQINSFLNKHLELI